MPADLDPNVPDLPELAKRAARVAALWSDWSVKQARNSHLKTCAVRLASHFLAEAEILAEMSQDPEAPHHPLVH